MISTLQRLANRAHVDDSKGFTLIELLIVVVIIGILAAIAIPQFSSTKESAYDSTARSDLRNLTTAQESHFADYQQYATAIVDPNTGTASSSNLPFNTSSGMNGQVSIETASEMGFEAVAQHPSSTNCFGIVVGVPDGTAGGDQGSGEVQNADNIDGLSCSF